MRFSLIWEDRSIGIVRPRGGKGMAKKKATGARKEEFIESMECLPVMNIPGGPEWLYEIKLDGYRLEAVRTAGETTLYSRRKNVLIRKFYYIAKALDHLSTGTVLDGERVAMGPDGKPNFNLLQNFKSAESHITYYAFDILVHKARDPAHPYLSGEHSSSLC